MNKTSVIMALLCVLAAGASAFEPGNLRYENPCKISTEDRPEFAEDSFNDSGWLDLKTFLGRRRQVESFTLQSSLIWNRVHLRISPELKGKDLVIGVEDAQLLDAVYLNGKPLLSCWQQLRTAKPPPRRAAFAIPSELLREDGDNVLALRYYYHSLPHEDTLGRVELREASTEDSVQIGADINPFVGVAPSSPKVSLTVSSGLPRAQEVKVAWHFEDYFGATLTEGVTSLSLKAAGPPLTKAVLPEGTVTMTLERPASGHPHKLVCWPETGKGRGPETWKYIGKLDSTSEFRMTRFLDKDWEFAEAPGVKEFTPSQSQSGDLSWQKIVLPHFIHDTKLKAHRIWYRTKLATPAAMADKRIALSFFQVAYQVDVFVDNVLVGTLKPWEMPGELDLTGKVTPGGTNELLLGVTDFIALFTPEAQAQAVDGDNAYPKSWLLGSAKGFASMPHAGLTCVPELKSYPKERRLDWVGVESEVDVPKGVKRLKLKVEVAGADKPLTVQSEILLRGKAVKRLPDTVLTNGAATVAVDFPEGECWTISTPTLYQARVRLLDGGKVVDEKSERFGLRQFGTAGRFITLNGFPCRMMGADMWIPSTAPRLAETLDLCRMNLATEFSFTHANSIALLDVFDEAGGLVAAEDFDLHACCRGIYALQDPRLYRNIVAKFERRIHRLYNHPAIMLWGWGCEFPYYVSGINAAEKGIKLACEAEAEIQRMDPSRFSSCTSIAMGRGYSQSRLLSTHNELSFSPGQGIGLGLWYFQSPENVPSYLRALFGTELSKIGWMSDSDKSQSRFWPGQKPAYNCEADYVGVSDVTAYQRYCTEPQSSKFGRRGFWMGPGSWFSGEVERGDFYRLGQTWTRGYCATTHCAQNAGEEKLARAVVFPKYWENKFRGGTGTDYPIFVVNNYLWPETLTMDWGFYDEDGKRLTGGRKQWQVAASTLLEDKLPLPLPEVKEPRYCRLVYTVASKTYGQEYRGWERLTIFPDAGLKQASAGLPTALYDPSGTTHAALLKAGIEHELIGKLTAAELARHRLLLIGDNGVDDAVVRARDDIRAAVEKGLTCAVLLQDVVKPIFPVTLVGADSYNVRGYLMNPSHPLMRDMEVDDFRFWRNPSHDHLVVVNPVSCPTPEGVQTIIDGGLLEIPAAQGRYVICQMPLARDLETEPAVARLFGNLLAYAKNPLPESPARMLHVLEADRPALDPWAKKLGLDLKPFPAAEPSKAVLLAKAATLAAANPIQIKNFVAAGGTLWGKDVDSDTATWLSQHLGLAVEVSPNPKTYALLQRRDPLVTGMTNLVLSWGLRNDPTPKDPTADDLGWKELKSKDGGAEPLLSPSYLLRFDCGKGMVVLDNIRWLDVKNNLAQTFSCQLAWNLGVRSASKPLNPDSFKSYDFTPLDLSAVVNRSFTDDVAGDKKGGWTDQGPNNDMSPLPVGTTLDWLGVPVRILDPAKQGGNGCIALSAKDELGLPGEVKNIKVGQKVDSLFFFHCMAGRPTGNRLRYRIWYEERKDWIPGMPEPNVDVVARDLMEIADWSGAGKDLPGARLAWVGKNRRQQIGFFMQEWKNPHPEKVIESIDIANVAASGQCFVIGITAARTKEK